MYMYVHSSYFTYNTDSLKTWKKPVHISAYKCIKNFKKRTFQQ